MHRRRRSRGYTSLLFLLSGLVITLLILPHSHEVQTLLIHKGMSHSDQIKAFRQISMSGHLTFWLSHLSIIRYGDYEIPARASLLSVLKIIWSNQSIMRKIKIPDGYSTRQIISMVRNHRDLVGDIEDLSDEGTLIGGTFLFSYGTSRTSILKVIQEYSSGIRNKLWNPNNPYFKDQKQWIIFASLLEKEGYDYEDKCKIAGVLLNRLKIGMKLQVDATLIYIKTMGMYNQAITWNEIRNQKFANNIPYASPYNTYVYKGLPPGPITNPSEESLKASLNPIKDQYLYYRLIGRKHVFSKSFKDHKKISTKKES